MRLTSLQKALLGAATLCRSVYVLSFICCIIGLAWIRPAGTAEHVSGWFWTLFISHGITMLLGAALQPIYVKLARSNPHISQQQRDYWAKAMLFRSVLSMPAYYLAHVWPGPASAARGPSAPPGSVRSTQLCNDEGKSQ